ncbi:lipoprotein insertase outer membrane protein LolB [Lysobacter sp. HA35]
MSGFGRAARESIRTRLSSPQRWLTGLVALTLLAGCATSQVTPTPVASDAATGRLEQCEHELATQTRWGLAGRIAISNARDAGSGRIEWRQDGQRFDIELTAPITHQGWRLHGEPGRATLDGLPGGPREGSDAESLLREATGWSIPVRSLPAWVRGMRADPGSAVVQFGADGRLAHLAESGWTIDYTWPADAAAARPSRIEARRDDARVRLVIDRWTDGTDAP